MHIYFYMYFLLNKSGILQDGFQDLDKNYSQRAGNLDINSKSGVNTPVENYLTYCKIILLTNIN